jgi:hypothetical protein
MHAGVADCAALAPEIGCAGRSGRPCLQPMCRPCQLSRSSWRGHAARSCEALEPTVAVRTRPGGKSHRPGLGDCRPSASYHPLKALQFVRVHPWPTGCPSGSADLTFEAIRQPGNLGTGPEPIPGKMHLPLAGVAAHGQVEPACFTGLGDGFRVEHAKRVHAYIT